MRQHAAQGIGLTITCWLIAASVNCRSAWWASKPWSWG